MSVVSAPVVCVNDVSRHSRRKLTTLQFPKNPKNRVKNSSKKLYIFCISERMGWVPGIPKILSPLDVFFEFRAVSVPLAVALAVGVAVAEVTLLAALTVIRLLFVAV